MADKLDPQKKIDLHLIRGDSYTIKFTISGMDLTGATVFFTVKSAIDADATDAAALIAVEVTDHLNPTAGVTEIPLSASDTTVTPGEYYYDIQVKKGSTVTSIPVRRCKIYGDITRRTT